MGWQRLGLLRGFISLGVPAVGEIQVDNFERIFLGKTVTAPRLTETTVL
jgi:hypothetical protein